MRELGWVIIQRDNPYPSGHARGPRRGSIYVSYHSAMRSRMHEYAGTVNERRAAVLRDYAITKAYADEPSTPEPTR